MRPAVIQAVTLLAEAHGRVVSETTFAAYEIGLEGVGDAYVGRAAARALREIRFMPSPSELRELAGVPSEADRAILAWSAVLGAIPHGPYQHMDFDDGISNAVVRSMGGWPTFVARFTDAEAEKWVRKEFIDAYARLSHARIDGEMCRPLAGLKECEGGDIEAEPAPLRIATGIPSHMETITHRQIPALTGRANQ